MGMSKEMLVVDKKKIKGGKDEFFVDLHLPLEQFDMIIKWGDFSMSEMGFKEDHVDFLQELKSMQVDIRKYMKK